MLKVSITYSEVHCMFLQVFVKQPPNSEWGEISVNDLLQR